VGLRDVPLGAWGRRPRADAAPPARSTRPCRRPQPSKTLPAAGKCPRPARFWPARSGQHHCRAFRLPEALSVPLGAQVMTPRLLAIWRREVPRSSKRTSGSSRALLPALPLPRWAGAGVGRGSAGSALSQCMTASLTAAAEPRNTELFPAQGGVELETTRFLDCFTPPRPGRGFVPTRACRFSGGGAGGWQRRGLCWRGRLEGRPAGGNETPAGLGQSAPTNPRRWPLEVQPNRAGGNPRVPADRPILSLGRGGRLFAGVGSPRAAVIRTTCRVTAT
jgi:hypothetical protein